MKAKISVGAQTREGVILESHEFIVIIANGRLVTIRINPEQDTMDICRNNLAVGSFRFDDLAIKAITWIMSLMQDVEILGVSENKTEQKLF